MLGAVNLASLLFVSERRGGGHVGNTRTLANIGSNACDFFLRRLRHSRVISLRVPATLLPPAGAFGAALFVSTSRRRSVRQLFPRRFPSAHLRRPLGVFCVGALQFGLDARFALPLVYFNQGIFNNMERRTVQRVRALPSRPISRQGLVSQALSPPDADRAAPSRHAGDSSFLGANVV
jgi:hypothetical protein